MSEGTLEIAVDLGSTEPRVLVPLHPREYMEALEKEGYREIHLTGLSQLKARYLDGTEGDEFTLWVESDAQFMLRYYSRLEDMVSQGRSELHRVYLVDGCFEFSAFVQSETVKVRVGVFKDSPFVPPFSDAIELRTSDYLAMWRGIAKALVSFKQVPQ